MNAAAAQSPAQQVIEVLQKIERAVLKLESVINGTLALVPGILDYIVEKVKSGWNALMTKLQEFWDWFTDKLSYVGDPVALFNTASGWKTSVGGPAKQLGRDLEDVDLRIDDTWQGQSASQYQQGVQPQRDALTSLTDDFATNIADALNALATAIIVFWSGVVVAILAIIVGFATATGAAVTVFGIPLAPPAALAGLAVGIGSLATGTIILFASAAGAKSSLDNAAGGITSWPAFVTS